MSYILYHLAHKSLILILFWKSLFILWVVFLLCFITFLILILLGEVYRPNIPQYPFNVFLDKIIPIIIICFIPLFAYTNPLELNLTILSLLCLSVQCVIITPLMYLWSMHRNWSTSINGPLVTWDSPIFFLALSLALIYPLIWGIYFSLSRYLRLGNYLDLSSIIFYITPDMIGFIIASLPLVSCLTFWCILSVLKFFSPYLSNVTKFRLFLWQHTSMLLYSFHIHLLQYNLYFFWAKNLFKLHYFLFTVLTSNSPMYITDNKSLRGNKMQKFFCYLYFNPYWFGISIVFIACLEIIITVKLFYTFYILFWYILVLNIIRCFTSYGFSKFVYDMCFSDYIRGNFITPRFPLQFWYRMEHSEFIFGISGIHNNLILDKVKQFSVDKEKLYIKNYDYTRNLKLLYRVSGVTRVKSRDTVNHILNRKVHPWYTRFKADFRLMEFRWFHCTSVLYYPPLLNSAYPSKLHPLLYHPGFWLTLSETDRWFYNLALVDSGLNDKILHQTSKNLKWPTTPYIFTSHPRIVVKGKLENLTDVREVAVASSLAVAVENTGYFLGTINEMRQRFPKANFVSNQKNPDVGLYDPQTTLAVTYDSKCGLNHEKLPPYIHGRNQILTTSPKIYRLCARDHMQNLRAQHLVTSETVEHHLKLLDSMDNYTSHFEVLFTGLHLYPPTSMHPAFSRYNLPLQGILANVQQSTRDMHKRLRILNKALHERNVPITDFTSKDISYASSLYKQLVDVSSFEDVTGSFSDV